MTKEESLKKEISELREQKKEIDKKLNDALDKCEHTFAVGYTLEPVVYCTICDREATEIFPNMAYKHIEKLVE